MNTTHHENLTTKKTTEFEDALSMCFKLIDPTNCSSSQTDLSVVKVAVQSLVDLAISQYSSSVLRIKIFSKLLEIIQSPLIYRKAVIRTAISAIGVIVCHEESLVNQTITFLAKILEFKGENLLYMKRVCIGALGRIGRRYPIYQNLLLISLFEKYFDNNVSNQDILCALLVGFGRFSQTNSQLRAMSMHRWLEAIDHPNQSLFRAAGIQALGYASCPTANVVNDKEIEAICYSKAIGLLQYHKLDDYKGEEENDPFKREDIAQVHVGAIKALGLLVRSSPAEWFPKLAKIFKTVLSSPRYQATVKASILQIYGQITYYLNASSSPFFTPLKVLLFELSADDNTTVSSPSCYALSKFGLSHEANYLEVKTILRVKLSNLQQAKPDTLVNYLKTWCKIVSRTYRPILNQCSSIISPLYSDLYDPDSDLANSLPLLKDKNKQFNISRQPQQKLQDNMALLDTAFSNLQHLMLLCQCFSPTVVQGVIALIKKPLLIEQPGFRKSLRDKILIQRSKGFMRNGEENYELSIKELASDVNKRKSFIQYLRTPELLADPPKVHQHQQQQQQPNITLLPPSSPQKPLQLKPHPSIQRAKPTAKPAATGASTNTPSSSLFGKPLPLIGSTQSTSTTNNDNSTKQSTGSRVFWPEQQYLSSQSTSPKEQTTSPSTSVPATTTTIVDSSKVIESKSKSPDSFTFDLDNNKVVEDILHDVHQQQERQYLNDILQEVHQQQELENQQSNNSTVSNVNTLNNSPKVVSLFSPLPLIGDSVSANVPGKEDPRQLSTTIPSPTTSIPPTKSSIFSTLKLIGETTSNISPNINEPQQQSQTSDKLFAPLALIDNNSDKENQDDIESGEEGKELEITSSPINQSSESEDDDDDDDDVLEIDDNDEEDGEEDEDETADINEQSKNTTNKKRTISLLGQLEAEAVADEVEIKKQTQQIPEQGNETEEQPKLTRRQKKILRKKTRTEKKKLEKAEKRKKKQLNQQNLKKQKKSNNNNKDSNLYVGINFSDKPEKPQVLCQFYKLGMCNKGDDCTFKHEGPVAEKKIEVCKFFKMGSCLKGTDCTFSHDLKHDPCKFFNSPGGCTNKECQYGHFISEELQLQLQQQQQYNSQQQNIQQQDNSLNDNFYSNIGNDFNSTNNNNQMINNNNNYPLGHSVRMGNNTISQFGADPRARKTIPFGNLGQQSKPHHQPFSNINQPQVLSPQIQQQNSPQQQQQQTSPQQISIQQPAQQQTSMNLQNQQINPFYKRI